MLISWPRSWRTLVLVSVATVLFLLTPLRVAIPCGAGMIAWWRLVGERKLERLAVFGSVAGLGTFWILFRFLAGPCGPNRAALLAAIAMAVTGLALLWMRPSRPGDRVGRELSFGRLGLLVLLALAIGVSTYAASGVLLGFNEAVELHIPLVASMQRGNWPPIDLREPPYAMEYHWGQHALAAGLATLRGTGAADLALFATNGATAALAFCAGFLVVSRHAGFFGGILGALLFFGAGTLNWTSAGKFIPSGELAQVLSPLFMPYTSGNLIVGGFFWRLHSNSTGWAFCCLLLAIELVKLAWEWRSRWLAIAAAVALALVAPTSETTFCGGLVAVVLVAMLQMRTGGLRSVPFRLGLMVSVVALVLAPLLGGVIETALSMSGGQNHWKLALNSAHFGQVPSWNFGGYFGDGAWVRILSMRFIQDAGPLPLLAFPVFVLAVWRRAWSVAIVASASVALLMATTTITLVQYGLDVFRMLSAAVSLGGLAFGYAAGVAVSSVRAGAPRVLARAAAIALVLFLVAAWPLSWAGLRCCGRPWPWPRANGGPMIDGPAVEWLKENSSFRDPVLTLPFGRSEVAASGQFFPRGNYLGARPEFPDRAYEVVMGPDFDALARMGVRYLYIMEDELSDAQGATLKAAIQQHRVSVVWGDTVRRRILLRIEGVAAH